MAGDKIPGFTLHRKLTGTASQVFSLWTDAKKIKVWLGLSAAEVDARLGGQFRLEMDHIECDPGIHAMHGVFKVFEPYRRMVMSWRYDRPSGEFEDTEVTIEIQDLRPGVRIRFTETGALYSNPHERSYNRLLWTWVLEGLESAVVVDRFLGDEGWEQSEFEGENPYRPACEEFIDIDPAEMN